MTKNTHFVCRFIENATISLIDKSVKHSIIILSAISIRRTEAGLEINSKYISGADHPTPLLSSKNGSNILSRKS